MKALILIGMFLLQQAQPQQPSGAISGRVIFRDGSPASRLSVIASAVPVAGRPPATARSFLDESGAYTIERVPEGNYYVRIALPGSAVLHPGVTTESAASSVVVAPGARVPNIDIVIPDSLSGVSVTGRVIYPQGQAPVPGTQRATLDFQKTSLIAEDGTFEFRHVFPGSYSIIVPSPGTPPARITVADRNIAGMEIVVPRFVDVNGTVTAEGGTRPALSILFEGQNFQTVVPMQPNGTFTTKLPEGQFFAAVFAGTLSTARFTPVGAPPFVPGYYVVSFSAESQNLITNGLKIAVSDSVVRIALALGKSAGVKVSGRFLSGGDNRGPAIFRKLMLTAMPTNESLDTPINSDGSFEISKMMPGTYRATVSLTPEVSSPPMVFVVPNRDVAGIEIAVPAPVEVTGRVAVDGNGPPPKFSLMLIRGGNLSVSVDANGVPAVRNEDLISVVYGGGAHVVQAEVNALPDGSFRMNLPQGDYRVFPTVRSPAYFVRSMTHGAARLFTEPLQVSEKEFAEIHIGFGATKANPWRKISGRVTGFDSSRGPLRVALESSLTATIETLIGPDGVFEFFNVLADTTYTIRLLPLSDATPTLSVVVADKDIEGLLIPVPRERDVPIRASVEGTAPLPTFILTFNLVAPATPAERIGRPGSTVSTLIKPEIDGSFTARLPLDERRVQVGGLPLGYIVKSLTYGSVDLLKSPVKLEGTDSSTINVVFAVDPAVPFGSIRGRVTGLDPELRDVRLVLHGAAAFATYETTIGGNGLFSFSKIPQGTYIPTLTGDVVSGLLAPSSIMVTGQDVTGIEINFPKGSTPPATEAAPVQTGTTLSDISNASLGSRRQAANEAAAVANLRTINTALITFLAASRGRYGTLGDLIDAGLLDSTFTGTKAGFTFSVIPVPAGYSAVALPGAPDTGRYGFFTTPDAVVRYSPMPILSPPRRGGNPVQ